MTRLLYTIILVFSLGSLAIAAVDDTAIDNGSLRLIKLTTLDDFKKYSDQEMSEADIPPQLLESVTNSLHNELYGYFGIQARTKTQQEAYIGLVFVSNAYGDYYYEELGEALGFSTGEFANINTFLNGLYRGKGLAKPIMDMLWEQCKPFVGKHHNNWSPEDEKTTRSVSPFKGLRGIVDLSNIPCLQARLKYGCSLASIRGVEAWVWQWPPKLQVEWTSREKVLHEAAKKIIAESLESFRTEPSTPGEIPSTEIARQAVSKYYPGLEAGSETPN
jgi:hypothetical protein